MFEEKESKNVICPECNKQTTIGSKRGFYAVHQKCKKCKRTFKINYNHEPIQHAGATAEISRGVN